MQDFGEIVYLDLQKTGSTFVNKFLNETCNLPLVKEIKHGRICESYNPNVFYFITIRHPLSQYSSLYRYGIDARGGLYNRLKRLGKDTLYQEDTKSFNQWLRFLLDEKNNHLLGEDYEKIPVDYNIGFLSFRYLMLSLASPLESLLQCCHLKNPVEQACQKSIVNKVIKNEELNKGLLQLVYDIKPEFFDQTKAKYFIEHAEKINTSNTKDVFSSEIESDVLDLLMKKERILMDFY